MSIEITVEPYSSWRQQNPTQSLPFPALPRCPPGCVPAPQPIRCPPGCVPAPQLSRCPPGYRAVERLYECRPVSRRNSISPRLQQIIDNQLRLISQGQQQQQQQHHHQEYRQPILQAASQAQLLQRTQSDLALSPSLPPASPLPNYALSHAASISASVDQLPAAIKEVLSVADNVVPQAGKVTYITSASCRPECQRPVTPPPPPRPRTPPPPPPRPRPVYIPPPRPSSPYEVLPIIHVDRCDPCDPCNQNRPLPADCCPPTTSSATLSNQQYMTIEIEISQPKAN